MRTAFVVILFAVSAFAQDQSAITAAESAYGPHRCSAVTDHADPEIMTESEIIG
jgi:hypothetical protein